MGISVSSATDVTEDAADVILLADGVGEGWRIFANTIRHPRPGTPVADAVGVARRQAGDRPVDLVRPAGAGTGCHDLSGLVALHRQR